MCIRDRSSPEPADPEPGSGGEEPAYTLESIQTNTGTQAILEQARAQQGQTRTLQIVLIVAAGIVAAGIIAFAIVRSRKKAGSQASTSQTADTGGNPVPDFGKEFNVSPIQYLQTLRLLLAKNLLTSTRLSVLDVAMSAG